MKTFRVYEILYINYINDKRIKLLHLQVIFIKVKKFILYILIIAVSLFLVAIVATTVMDQTGFGFKTITFNNATAVDVPASDAANSTKDAYGIYRYKDSKNNLNITSWNSMEVKTISGADLKVRDVESLKGMESPAIEKGVPIYYNSDFGLYYAQTGNDTTHDNILISANNKDLVIKVYETIRYGSANASKLNVNMSKIVENTTNTTNVTANVTYDNPVNYSYYSDDDYSENYDYSTNDEGYYDQSYYESYYDDDYYYYDEGSYSQDNYYQY